MGSSAWQFTHGSTEPELDPLALFYDGDVLAALAAALRAADGELEAVRRALQAPRWTADDIGFGARAARGDRTAGTFDLRLEVVAHRGRVAWLEAELRWRVGPGGSQRALVRELVGEHLAPARGQQVALVTLHHAETLAAMDAERHASLGAPPAVSVPPELAEPLSLLTSLRTGLIVGEPAGEGSERAPGPAAIAELVAAGRLDLLQVALRGPNPAGRVLAARALIGGLAGAPSEDDLRAIAILRADAAPILAGSGRLLRETSAARLLAV